jgi:protein-tyrosine phosphatase
MVDIHSHILPDVDDGAEDIEESLKILRKAAASGVDTIVATPHLIRGMYETTFSEREELVADLQKAVDENGIDIQIKSGVECYLTPEILEDADKLKELTINNTGKYILVELPMQIVPPYAEDVLSKLIMQGVTPVLAHPARNMGICQNPNILYDFVTKGCVGQLNVGSILGSFGRHVKKTARILLTHRLVHVVASDMHSPDSVTMDQAIPAVEELLDQERASFMFTDIPRQIVAGEEFFKEPPERYEPTRRSLKDIIFGRRA